MTTTTEIPGVNQEKLKNDEIVLDVVFDSPMLVVVKVTRKDEEPQSFHLRVWDTLKPTHRFKSVHEALERGPQ